MYFENMQSAITRIFTFSVPKSNPFVKKKRKRQPSENRQPPHACISLFDKALVNGCARQIDAGAGVNILIDEGKQIIGCFPQVIDVAPSAAGRENAAPSVYMAARKGVLLQGRFAREQKL